jgi:hypothetical protein
LQLTCLLLTLYAEFSVVLPMPNSSMFVFPIRTAPAALSRATVVASKGGRYVSSTLLPAVVRRPAVQMLSCNSKCKSKSMSESTSGVRTGSCISLFLSAAQVCQLLAECVGQHAGLARSIELQAEQLLPALPCS